MTGIIQRFAGDQIMVAYARWAEALGVIKTLDDFFDWLGFTGNVSSEYWDSSEMAIACSAGSTPCRKLEMLLSPHWLALAKAWQARQGTNPCA